MSVHEVARFPQRIFADLVPKPQPAAVLPTATLDDLLCRFATDRVEVLAVIDELGRFVGALTQTHLLSTLLVRERQLLTELREQATLQDRYQKLISYEIHDGISQMLASTVMHLQAAEHLGAEMGTVPAMEPASFSPQFQQLRDQVQTSLELAQLAHAEARRLVSGLRPAALDDWGLVPALRRLADQQSTPAFQVDVLAEELAQSIPEVLEHAVFRIVQESLTNAKKASGSPRCLVHWQCRRDRCEVTIQDWGRGFDPQQSSAKQFGLRGIRERTRLLGGQVTIESAPGKGTRISATWPLPLAVE